MYTKTPCGNCGADVYSEDLFCGQCGFRNPDFNLTSFNQGCVIFGHKIFATAEESMGICSLIGEEAMHNLVRRHNELFEPESDLPNPGYCNHCGKRVAQKGR